MDCASGPAGGLFRTSFLEKGLVTFAECVKHYDSFDAQALLDEMRLLLTPPMLAVPFGVSSARYYALMDALVRCAGNNRDLGDAQRAKLVKICVDICVFLRGRTKDGRQAAFDTALSNALDAVRSARVRPEVAHAISQGTRKAAGTAVPGSVPARTPPDAIQALDFQEPPAALRVALSA